MVLQYGCAGSVRRIFLTVCLRTATPFISGNP